MNDKIDISGSVTVKSTSCFVWVQNLASYSRGRTRIVFENRVLRRIFGPEVQEVAGG
jgi:PAS domain-containing protein